MATMTSNPIHNRLVQQAVNIQKARRDAAVEALVSLFGPDVLPQGESSTTVEQLLHNLERKREYIEPANRAAERCEASLYGTQIALLENTTALRTLIEDAGRTAAAEVKAEREAAAKAKGTKPE